MNPRVRQIRSAARAVIIHEGRLLTIQMRDERGVFYVLPGGGQHPGETLEDTVRREVKEEAGVDVEVEGLLYVREYIGRNHRFSKYHTGFHQLEHVFRCRVVSPESVCVGAGCDQRQVGVTWVPLAEISSTRFFPEAIKPFFNGTDLHVPALYLGDCN